MIAEIIINSFIFLLVYALHRIFVMPSLRKTYSLATAPEKRNWDIQHSQNAVKIVGRDKNTQLTPKTIIEITEYFRSFIIYVSLIIFLSILTTIGFFAFFMPMFDNTLLMISMCSILFSLLKEINKVDVYLKLFNTILNKDYKLVK